MALASASVLAWPLAAPASPPDTAWIEDIRLHPGGPSEFGLVYETHVAPSDATANDVSLVTVRAISGFDRAPLEFTPSLVLRQDGTGGASINEFGVRIRTRIVGTTGEPKAIAYAGYRLLPLADRAHALEQGAAARWHSASLTYGAEIGLRQVFAGASDTQVELRVGGAVTYRMLVDYLVLNAEVFALVPITGPRISDSAVGEDDEDGEDIAIYAGPSVRFNLDYLWFALGAAAGRITGDGAPLLVRASFGVQF